MTSIPADTGTTPWDADVLGVLMAPFTGTDLPDWMGDVLEAGLASVILFGHNTPDPETTRSDMCSYTHSEREINKFHIGKILFHFFFEFFQFIWIQWRSHVSLFDYGFPPFLQAQIYIYRQPIKDLVVHQTPCGSLRVRLQRKFFYEHPCVFHLPAHNLK